MPAIALKDLVTDSIEFFNDEVVKRHKANIRKLEHLDEFAINPFTLRYLAETSLSGQTATHVAEVLVRTRINGSSISTTFATLMPKFAKEVLGAKAHRKDGLSVHFQDAIDGARRYAWIAGGPNNLNVPNAHLRIAKFQAAEIALKASGDISSDKQISAGVIYGTSSDLNNGFTTLKAEYPVHVGAEFWHRLSGYPDFYDQFLKGIRREVAGTSNEPLIKATIAKLAVELSRKAVY